MWGRDGWTIQDELAALTVEMLDAVRIQVAALTADKSVKRWRPFKVPRPEAVKPKKQSGWKKFIHDVAGGRSHG